VSTFPDILEIQPLTKPPDCAITVPGSKSITNRALILAALADGKCTLRGALWADDTQVMVASLQKLGFEVTVKPHPAEESNRTITVLGRGGVIPAEKAELYVGNAGTAARFLSALVALGDGEYKITGNRRMQERPMTDLFVGLRELGVDISPSNRLPATIRSWGRLTKGKVAVSARHSTQFASALLLISSHAGIEVELAEPEEPHGYIAMTRKIMETFRRDYVIEPDLSSASYFAAAGFMTGGKVEVAGWPLNSLQMDGQFPRFLPPPATVSRLRDLGDSVMTLAITALFGAHSLEVTDAERLREQECDRIHAIVTELERVGAKADEHITGFRVHPASPGQLHGADIETYNDHRMAMCFSVLGLKVPGIRIKNPSCVSKTFPNFFDKLEQLRR
jgi:3-phosphoshikimate 1-carboxyvinyltransferase